MKTKNYSVSSTPFKHMPCYVLGIGENTNPDLEEFIILARDVYQSSVSNST